MGENIGLEVKSASSCTTYHMVMGKRDAGSDAPAKVILIYSETEIRVLCFEVEILVSPHTSVRGLEEMQGQAHLPKHNPKQPSP